MQRGTVAFFSRVALVLLLLSGSGTWVVAQQRPFGLNSFGQGSNFADFGPPSQLQQDIGVQWSRVGLNWFNIQPDGSGPNPPPTFAYTDSMVNPLTSRGIEVVGLLKGVPQWASSNPGHPNYFQYPPVDFDDWEAYVAATVNHYKDSIDYWEVWNEPNYHLTWRPAPDLNAYVDMLQRTWNVIKGPGGVDPDANIVLGGLSGYDLTFLKGIIDAGGWNFIDVVAIHPYEFVQVPEYFERVDNLNRLRAFVAQNGAKPIWYTEVAWPSVPYTGTTITPAQQGDYLVRDYVQSIALGADRNSWWKLREDANDPSQLFMNTGLYQVDMTPKPAATAFTTMTSQLSDKTFVGRRNPYVQNLITGFETAEPWATETWMGSSTVFARNGNIKLAGTFSGGWGYTFPPLPGGNGSLVTLLQEIPLPGTPRRLSVWVKPDDGDHKLSIDFKDAGGEIFRVRLGYTIGTEWQQMTADLVDAVGVSGGDGTINYPISFWRFFLENSEYFSFYGSTTGTIYLDDLTYDDGDAHVYDYQFTGSGGDLLDAIWTTDEGVTRAVPFPASSATVTDVAGSSTVVSDGGAGDLDGVANGFVTIGATDSPVFVAWQPGSGGSSGYYVLDRYGGVHPGGGAAPFSLATPYWGFDVAQDMELTSTGGYYVLDRFGGIHPGGGASAMTPATPYWGFDVAQDIELATVGYYVLDRFGGVHAGGGAPVQSPSTPYWGFDVAQDLQLATTGYYVLDRYGGVHTGGGAPVLNPPTPYWGFNVAQDLELASTGHYVLDRFGGVHAGGGAPVLSPATPYWGFDVAQGLELATTGYYVLDRYGGVHPGGGAPVLNPTTPYWGFDVAQDLELQ